MLALPIVVRTSARGRVCRFFPLALTCIFRSVYVDAAAVDDDDDDNDTLRRHAELMPLHYN